MIDLCLFCYGESGSMARLGAWTGGNVIQDDKGGKLCVRRGRNCASVDGG